MGYREILRANTGYPLWFKSPRSPYKLSHSEVLMRCSMHAVSFRMCDCGMELRLLQQLDERKQSYACDCGRELEFFGTILNMHTALPTSPFSTVDWKPVHRFNSNQSAKADHTSV